jgi:hypothetical protein
MGFIFVSQHGRRTGRAVLQFLFIFTMLIDVAVLDRFAEKKMNMLFFRQKHSNKPAPLFFRVLSILVLVIVLIISR